MSLFAHQPFSGYLHHWSLERPPFLSGPDFFFSGQPQRETLASLQFFATSILILAFLTAVSRSGISHLLDHMVSMRGLGTCPLDVILTRSHGEGSTAIQQLGSVLGQGCHDLPVGQMIDTAIQQSDRQGIRTLWFIENCTASTIGVAMDYARRHRNFSVVATTQPDQRSSLQLSAGVCGMQIQLTPLSPEDTVAYVDTALKQAGSTRAIFSETAIARLHRSSAGLIGDIAVIAESALTTAACRGQNRITPDTIDLVVENHKLRCPPKQSVNDESPAKRVA